LRASDADRERAADRLRRAAAEGRLVTDELEQRLEAAFAARTYAKLDAVLADLPGRRLAPPRSRHDASGVPRALVAAIAVPAIIAAILVVVLVVTGVFAGWVLWLVAGWWFFGRHRRRCLPGRRHPGHMGGRRLAP
jgi:Flp pilus assembly protein TadB